MKRTALFLAALALAACDSEPQDPSEARLAELDSEDDLADSEVRHEGHHGKHGKRHDLGAEVCEAVACTDAQLEQVNTIFARPERGERPERPDLSEANATLAEAFAGAEFGTADMRAWSEQLPARPDRKSHRVDAMSELYTVLTSEQRTVLAEKVSAGEVFAGRGEGHRKHGGPDADERQDRHVTHFCEPLDCSDAQQAELSEIFGKKHDSRPDPQTRLDAIAAAFKADTFDAEGLQGSCEHDTGDKSELVVQVHAVLTPEQRTILSERIAEHGPRGLMGKGGKHHRRGKRRGKGKRRGRPGGREAAQDGGPEFG
ncbi:MAG: hypothetical protein ACRBN8_25405 [Nannocystales bacterium]